MVDNRIIHGARLQEVLRQELQEALAQESLATCEATEYYLVQLLSDYHAPARGRSFDADDRALSIRYIEALTSPASQRTILLRAIGDAALIALGFFAESLRRGIVGLSHYQAIGGRSYQALAGLTAADAFFSAVYEEMAVKFVALTRVLTRLAPWNQAATDADIVNLYRRWSETGDAGLAERLEREGIPAHDPAPGSH